MYWIVLSIVVFVCSNSYAVTQFKFDDGKPKWIESTVDGDGVYSEDEKNKVKDEKTKVNSGTTTAHTPTIVDVTPTNTEINISTCPLKFLNYSDMSDCQKGNKGVIGKKLSELKVERDKFDFDKNSTEYIDYNSRYLWLLSHYNTLQ